MKFFMYLNSHHYIYLLLNYYNRLVIQNQHKCNFSEFVQSKFITAIKLYLIWCTYVHHLCTNISYEAQIKESDMYQKN